MHECFPLPRVFLRPGALVFLVALAVRCVYLFDVADYPGFLAPVVDSYKYHHLARLYAAEGYLSPQVFDQSPFYPIFLGLVYRAGGDMTAARLLQVVLGALSCSLIALLGWRLFGRRAGISAGFVAAAYGPLVFYDAELLAAGWAVFLAATLGTVLLRLGDLLREDEAGNGHAFFHFGVLGIVSGLAIVTGPSFVPVVAVGGAWLGWHGRGGGWRRSFIAGATAAFFLGGCVLWGFGQAACGATGEARILSKYGSINLYMGNQADSSRLENIRPGIEWLRLKKRPELDGASSPGEQKAWFKRQVLGFAVESPVGFLRNLGRKTLMFVSSREIPNSVSMELTSRWAPFLRVLVWRIGSFGFPFGALFPLVLVGFVGERRRIPVVLPILVLSYSATIVATHACARYRLPVLPWLIPVAVGGAMHLAALARRREGRALAAWLGVCVATGFAISLPRSFARERDVDYEAEMYRYLGLHGIERGDLESAERWFAQALVRQPDSPEVRVQKVLIAIRRGDPHGGLEIARDVIARAPDLPEIHRYAGFAYQAMGRMEEAVAAYRRCVELDPQDGDGQYYLGCALLQQGDADGAIAALECAQRLAPWSRPVFRALERARAFGRLRPVAERGR